MMNRLRECSKNQIGEPVERGGARSLPLEVFTKVAFGRRPERISNYWTSL